MKESITQKLYFKKYDHRVVLICKKKYSPYKGKKDPIKAKRPSHTEVLEYAKTELGDAPFSKRVQPYHERKKISGRNASRLWWYDYDYRYEGETVTLYFKDASLLTKLKAKYPDYILEVERPVDQSHSDVLNKDRVLTRNKLFHDKYRYCIRTSMKYEPGSYRWSNSHIKKMIQWHSETFGHLTSGVDYHVYKGNSTNFFFANAQDAIMMKLVWGEDIDHTDRIVLLSEIDSTKAA